MSLSATFVSAQQDTTITVDISYEQSIDTVVVDILYTEWNDDRVLFVPQAEVVVSSKLELWNGKPQRAVDAAYFYRERRIRIIK